MTQKFKIYRKIEGNKVTITKYFSKWHLDEIVKDFILSQTRKE